MKLKDDIPIHSKENDLLNRSEFANNLAYALLNVESQKSFCVGLFGEWGSGKTSVINLLLEEIQHNLSKEYLPIIFKFEPWLISGQDSLIKSFLSELQQILKNINNSKSALKTSDLLFEYEKSFNSQEKQSYFTENEIYNFEKNTTLIKELLTKELKSLNNIILVIIDDIDRLPDNEIIQIFKLIKAVADFPNIRYLVSFDRSIVVNALNELQKGKGDEYLEKIIQVNFELPLLSTHELQKILGVELFNTISSKPNTKFDEDYWYLIYHNGFKKFFRNLRDIKRYVNTLNFNFALLSDSISAVDFFVIIAIQVFEKNIYTEIWNNKELFIISENELTIRAYSDDLSEYFIENKNLFERIFSKARKLSSSEVKNLLELVFPKIKESFDKKKSSNYYDEVKWRKNGRVCSKENFDTFFKLGLPKNELSLIEIENTLNLSDSELELRKTITSLIEQHKILKFLERLEDYTEEVFPIKNIETIIIVFMDMGDLFPESEQGMFPLDTSMKLMRIIYRLLKRIPDANERLRILKSAMEKAQDSLLPLVKKVSIEEQAIEKRSTEEIEEGRLFSKEQLPELKNVAIQKIDEWIKNSKIFQHPEIAYFLYRLKDWKKPELVTKIVDEIKNDNVKLVNLISSLSTLVRSSHKGNYLKIRLENVSDFLNINDVEAKLREIFKSNEFNNFEKKEQEVINLFLDTFDGKIKDDF